MKKLLTLLASIAMWTASFSQTIVWSEDFEGDWTQNWYADNGTWDVGTPTVVGPSSAHGGVSCAATNLSGNYTDDIETRLIRYTWVTIPKANKNPRLRFWHWFSFSTSDIGRVQVKTPTGAWTDITDYYYYNTASGVWTVEDIDLSEWADSTVQIAFYFHSHNYTGGVDVSSGWYVDDLEIRTGDFTFNDPEGFEGGYGDWSVDMGTWEIGSPTYGPSTAHAGTSCAGTKLSGAYDDEVVTRLRSAWVTIPKANKNPRLRFWHWFSFSTSDIGRVQVKTPTGAWTDITDYYYYNTASGVWTVEDIDLSEWADSTVQIAFYFYSHNYTGGVDVSSGWYVDDLEIRTGDFTFNDPEGFEGGYGDWSVDMGTWEIGSPTYGPSTAHAGTSCAGTKLSGAYDDEVVTRLRSAWVTIPKANKNPRLRFWHWFSFSTSDIGRVQVKTPTGAWTDITDYYYYNTASGVWTVEDIDLSEWADSTVQIAFYFHSHNYTGGVDVSSGWYVDDIELRTGDYCIDDFEDFEAGYFTWAVDMGTWEIGEPTSGPGSPYSGTKCAATKLGGNYDDDVDTRLHIPWLTIPAISQSPSITFRHWFSFSSSDNGTVEVKTKTSNWIPVSGVFSGSSSTWTFYYASLASWADSTVQIAFHLHTHNYTGGVDVSSGWYIDDITISGLGTQPPPTLPDEITKSGGSAKVCPGDIRNYSTTQEEGVTYWWTAPEGAKIMSGQETNSIVVLYTDDFTDSDTLSVVKINCGGSSPTRDLIINRNNPGAPSEITGPYTEVCAGTSQSYNVISVSGITYNWTAPLNASIPSGQGTNSVAVYFSAAFTDGLLKVTANNACGASQAKKLNVYSVPQKPGAITGNSTVCSGSIGEPYSIEAVVGATSYKWIAPDGSHISDGIVTSNGASLTTTATSVTVDFGTIGNNAKISVKGLNSCGSGSAKKLTLDTCMRLSVMTANETAFELYPNPSEGRVTLKFTATTTQNVEIVVTDMAGREMLQQQVLAVDGQNILSMNLNFFAAGVYLLKLRTLTGEQVKCLVKE